MKRMLVKWITALLIAGMLLSSVAFMEEAVTENIPMEVDDIENSDGSGMNISEEKTVEIPEEEASGEVIIESAEADEILPEAIDDAFEEEEFDLFTYEEQDDLPIEEVIEEASLQYEASLSDNIAIDENHFPDAKFRTYITAKYDRDKNNALSAEEISNATHMNIIENCPSDLTGIKLFTNLQYLSITSNPNLAKLEVSDCSSLREIDVSGGDMINGRGALTELNVSGCTKLETIDCNFNQLTKLDISGCINLYKLICSDNQLAGINTDGCLSLDIMDCRNNKLTELDLSQAINLTFLEANGNPGLKTLDISYCIKMLPYLTKSNRDIDDGVVTYTYDTGDVYIYLSYDKDITMLITKHDAANTVTANTVITGTDSGLRLTIPATKKRNKSTVIASPGTIYQLDLDGKIGKKFKSSKKKVAVVDGNGNVTIRGAGKTKITFKVGKKKRTVTLTVKDPTVPGSVTLNVPTTAVKKGDVITLTANLPAGTNSAIKWTSSNKKVATVNNGVVTFKKKGKVTITATAVRGKKKAKVKFKVSK